MRFRRKPPKDDITYNGVTTVKIRDLDTDEVNFQFTWDVRNPGGLEDMERTTTAIKQLMEGGLPRPEIDRKLSLMEGVEIVNWKPPRE